MPEHTNSASHNQDSLTGIIKEVFSITAPKIDGSRRSSISQLIQTTVNGDVISSYLVISAALGKDRKGILVYILTNLRLIKIEIDEREIQSSSFLLDTMIGIERKLITEDSGARATVEVSFQNGSLGLRYAPNQKITEFFQKVDQARVPSKS